MTDFVLQTTRLAKRFGSVQAVKDLSLEIRAGEVFGFLGPNGAGKTTSINMICGLIAPDSGEVRIHGESIRGNGGITRRIGVCPQDIVLWERLTCREQMIFIGEMYGLPARTARERADLLLAEMNLEEKRNAQARTLSGGLQRRLNLVMALVHDPEIVILDEPEAGLDPQSRVRVRQYIQSLARRKTVILTTHNMDEADRVADRIAIIDHGELLRTGTPGELKRTIGEGDVVEIRLEGDPPQLAAALAAARAADPRADARLEADLLSVRMLDAVGRVPDLVESIRRSGARAAEMRIRENTLEDAFLQLTGRRLRE
ncbi:MAG: ABC transporter ATP-binding protein [Anaerolineales bacterium]|nr:ABC transporter ATP-binding protein [Anaerolineales bacterium]